MPTGNASMPENVTNSESVWVQAHISIALPKILIKKKYGNETKTNSTLRESEQIHCLHMHTGEQDFGSRSLFLTESLFTEVGWGITGPQDPIYILIILNLKYESMSQMHEGKSSGYISMSEKKKKQHSVCKPGAKGSKIHHANNQRKPTQPALLVCQLEHGPGDISQAVRLPCSKVTIYTNDTLHKGGRRAEDTTSGYFFS